MHIFYFHTHKRSVMSFLICFHVSSATFCFCAFSFKKHITCSHESPVIILRELFRVQSALAFSSYLSIGENCADRCLQLKVDSLLTFSRNQIAMALTLDGVNFTWLLLCCCSYERNHNSMIECMSCKTRAGLYAGILKVCIRSNVSREKVNKKALLSPTPSISVHRVCHIFHHDMIHCYGLIFF